MSGWQRVFAVTSHLAVALWLGGYLAWSATRATPAPPPPADAPTARIQPRPETPAPPAPAAEPPPEIARAAPAPPLPREPLPEAEPEPAAPTHIGRADITRGDALLDGTGDFPALSASYEDFASFRDYARSMQALGARFVVVRHRKILGGIDPESGVIRDASLDRAFSPRARDYSGEPEIADMALAVRGRYGRGAEVMMLVPRELDAGLFGGIAAALARRGERHADYREIRGRYVRGTGGGVHLHLDAGIRSDGRRVAFDLLFDLGDIVRAQGRAA